MKKTLLYCLVALNFLLPFSLMTNLLDADLGWHLRFGQELHSGGAFPFLDTYTYSFYGQPWVNHEWGGDWLLWLIYSRIGYVWIDILMSLSILFSTLIIGKIFFKKINSLYLAISLLALYCAQPVFVGRLAMLTPLFFALIIFSLEKYKTDRRFAALIPIIFCTWSMLHGSFTLGFIIIGIYLAVAIFENLLNDKFKKYTNEKPLTYKQIFEIIIATTIGATLIAINNPYSLDIWKESLHYFGESFYKKNITEWVPVYVFPIFWKILFLQTIALFFAIYGFLKKRISLTHFTVFLALFISAIMYKRQMIFMAILCPTILAITAEHVWSQAKNLKIFQGKTIYNILIPFSITVATLAILGLLSKSIYTNSPWDNRYLIENSNNNDYEALIWLQNNTKPGEKIFNEFSWGATLNWMLPNNPIFLDGRGTVTWKYNPDQTMLERYSEIKYKKDGLQKIEKDGADFIFIRSSKFATFTPPDWFNLLIFGKNTFREDGDFFQKTELEKDLEASNNWEKVFSSQKSNIYKRTNLEQP